MVNIGINVLEVEGKTAPAIAGAPTSVAGFVVRTRRGPTDQAIRVSNFQQFVRRFGGYHPDYLGAYCVDGFFLNGGREAYIARVVGGKPNPASLNVQGSDGNPTLTITAGYRGKSDVGAWGNDLCVDIQPSPSFATALAKDTEGNQPARVESQPFGISTANLSPLGDPDYILRPKILCLRVDDEDISINFNHLLTPERAPLKDVVDLINVESQGKIVAFLKDKQILLASCNKGDTSIEIKQDEEVANSSTLTELGFKEEGNYAKGDEGQVATLTGEEIDESIDLTDVNQITILIDTSPTPIFIFPKNETLSDLKNRIAQITGVQASLIDGAEGKKKFQISSETVGKRSRIALVVDNTIDELKLSTGQVYGNTWDDDGYSHIQVESIAGLKKGDWIYLDDGITRSYHKISDLKEENTPEGELQYYVSWDEGDPDNLEYLTDETTLSTCEFDLFVKKTGPAETRPIVLETWEKISLDPEHPNYCEKVNDPTAGSGYVVLSNPRDSDTTYQGNHFPQPITQARLGVSNPPQKGSDGAVPNAADYRQACNRFKTIDIQLLAVSEVMGAAELRAVTRAAIDFCENKGDCLFVGHTPSGLLDPADAKKFGQNFRAAKVYGALYWPWIKVTDPMGSGPNPIKEIPPTGHVMGTYARIDQTRGVWKAPAGNETALRGALGIEQDIQVTDIDHTDLVKNGSVNGIRSIRGAGIVIDASRTLSTDSRWLYVNVRLLFNYVKASLREGLRWVKQEPNRETLWNKIKYNTVTPFLQRLYQGGAFGPGAPEDVFTVICDSANNPPDQIQLGNLKVEISFYPSRPAETIIITVAQQDGGASASDQ